MMYSFRTIFRHKKPRDILLARGPSTSLGLALFGGLRFLLSRGLLALILLFASAFVGRHHDKHGTSLHLRRNFDGGDIRQGSCDLLQIFERDLRVIHFAAAEPDRHTDFVPLKQPAAGIVHFETAVRFICLRTEADLLDLDLGLCFLGLTFFFGAFINELAVIDYAAHRGIGIRRDFYKVQLGVACDLQGLTYGYNTNVAAIRPDQADLRDADALIYSKF